MPVLGVSLALGLSWWLATLGVVFVSGAFPAAQRPEALRGPLAMAGIMTLATAALSLAALSVVLTSGLAPWPHVLVAAGLGAVLAPPCFALIPHPLVDRPGGAVLLAATCTTAAAGWLWLAAVTGTPAN